VPGFVESRGVVDELEVSVVIVSFLEVGPEGAFAWEFFVALVAGGCEFFGHFGVGCLVLVVWCWFFFITWELGCDILFV